MECPFTHSVPSKCFETVAVNLLGPMLSSKYVVVVQDLGSRYRAAKLVNSAGVSKVLPALGSIYDAYGNPKKQVSDSLIHMQRGNLLQPGGIQMKHIASLHPSANTAENFMHPLGKKIKIANLSKVTEKTALEQLLANYHDMPHPAIGLSLASMMFRYGQEGNFSRVTASNDAIFFLNHFRW